MAAQWTKQEIKEAIEFARNDNPPNKWSVADMNTIEYKLSTDRYDGFIEALEYIANHFGIKVPGITD